MINDMVFLFFLEIEFALNYHGTFSRQHPIFFYKKIKKIRLDILRELSAYVCFKQCITWESQVIWSVN